MVIPRTRILLVLGAALTVVGACVTVLYLFQPWRTCPSDDTAAGCGMLPVDAAVMGSAMAAACLGAVVLAVGLVRRARAAR